MLGLSALGGAGHVLAGGSSDDFINMLGTFIEPTKAGKYKAIVDAAKENLDVEALRRLKHMAVEDPEFIADNIDKAALSSEALGQARGYMNSVGRLGAQGTLYGALAGALASKPKKPVNSWLS